MRWMLFLTFLLPLAGCGGADSGPVLYVLKGSVQFEGAPIESGEVILVPADGSGSPAGATIANGAFELKAPAGLKTVRITAMRDVPGKFREDNPGEKVAVREQYIPKKYNDESTLTMTVEAKSPNEVDWQLSK